MEKLLEKKTAIITGAANGVGQIISQKFSEEGANLILADMDESNLKKEADLIRKSGSGNTSPKNLKGYTYPFF